MPPDVQADLEDVINEALSLAQHLLEKNGEFFPCGVTMDLAGEIAVAAADPGQGEHPASVVVLDLLYDGARQDRDSLRAVAFAADVVTDGQDAIRAAAEHREGDTAWEFFLPYRRTGLRKKLEFAEPWGQTAERRVWD